jgi:hypothetical protein
MSQDGPAIGPEERYKFRMLLLIDTIGLELIERDPVVNAIAVRHAMAQGFSLSRCLADMVKELATGKAEVMANYQRYIEERGTPVLYAKGVA